MADSDKKDSPINEPTPGKRKKQKLDLELLDKGPPCWRKTSSLCQRLSG